MPRTSRRCAGHDPDGPGRGRRGRHRDRAGPQADPRRRCRPWLVRPDGLPAAALHVAHADPSGAAARQDAAAPRRGAEGSGRGRQGARARRCSPAGCSGGTRSGPSTRSTSPIRGLPADLVDHLQSFAWLRDLAAAATREHGARERRGGDAPLARRAWRAGVGAGLARRSVRPAHPALARLRALHPVGARPGLSLGGAARAGARRPASGADLGPRPARRRPDRRLGRRDRLGAGASGRAGAAGVGRGRPRPRAPPRAARRWRADQPLADRAGRSGRDCWVSFAPSISPPGATCRTGSARRWPAARRPCSPRPWATRRCRAGRAAIWAIAAASPARSTRPAARSGRFGARAAGAISICRRETTILVFDAAPPPPARALAGGCASTLAFELSDGPHRLIVNCGGEGAARGALPAGPGLRAQDHRRLLDADPRRSQLDRDPPGWIARQGRDRGRGVARRYRRRAARRGEP